MPADLPRLGQRVAPVAGLDECVWPEAEPGLGGNDVVDDGRVVPRVEVVDQLRALVAEEPGVLETRRPLHTFDASATIRRCDDGPVTEAIEFYFDPMCPWAYQTSVWMRDVRAQVGLAITWKFFSLEEINRPEGKRHPWERPIAYGWTPMRIAAWLRRTDMDLCDRWYEACGRALHVDGRRFYNRDVADELLASIGAPSDTWDAALADLTTHDDVRADHDHAVAQYGAFGVPIIVLPNQRTIFGPVVVPAPTGAEAMRLWELCLTYSEVSGLFELKTPKTRRELRSIANTFRPYLTAREWTTIQNPAP